MVVMTAAGVAGAGPAPVARVDLRIGDIWSPAEVDSAGGVLGFVRRGMNAVHPRTREGVIRREVLVRPGEPCDPALLAETERNLRALGFLAEVAVAPADTLPDGSVVVEVRAREAWTLKTQFAYARSSTGDQRWSLLLEDRNFAGRGTQATLGAGGDEDRTWRLAAWRSPRLRGSAWQLAVAVADQSDGGALALQVERPFRRQDDPWALKLRLERRDADVRWYLSNAGPAGADPARAASLYAELPSREEEARLTFLRRVAGRDGGRLWRLGPGLELSDNDYRPPAAGVALSDGRIVDAGALGDDPSTLARESRHVVRPFLALETEGRAWTQGRYLLQYGPVEDVALAPALRLQAGWSARALGAGREAALVELSATDWSRAPGGFWLVAAEGSAALGAAAQRTAGLDLVAGWLGRGGAWLGRAFAEAAWADRPGGRDALLLGLGRGLRTLEYDGQAGDRLARWTAEVGRPLPVALLGFWQLGLAAHYAGGAAWWRGEERGLADARHEAGVGLRLGATRAGRAETARVDLTWDLGGGAPVVTAVTGGLF